jgi:hypothetical protein
MNWTKVKNPIEGIEVETNDYGVHAIYFTFAGKKYCVRDGQYNGIDFDVEKKPTEKRKQIVFEIAGVEHRHEFPKSELVTLKNLKHALENLEIKYVETEVVVECETGAEVEVPE